MPLPPFDQLTTEFETGGVDAVLDRLIAQLREQKNYHQLHEALMLQARHRFGLPLVQGPVTLETESSLDKQQEDRLLETYREIYLETGMLFIDQGQLRDGWVYLRAIGEKDPLREVLKKTSVTEENLEEFIELALNEGIAPLEGFSAVLENYGTCNAITSYENLMPSFSLEDQQATATLLLEKIHNDLCQTVRTEIAAKEGKEPPQQTLEELVTDRDWLFSEGNYHLDTTHLAATVRFARILHEEQPLRLALDLTHYGRLLHEQFQYAGEEPFVDIYPSHALFFQIILGDNIDEALEYFQKRSQSVDIYEQGSAAAEIYISLLSHCRRYPEAIEATMRLIPPGSHTHGYAPSLLELSEKANDYQEFLQSCRQREDMLGFTLGLIEEKIHRS